MSGMPTKSVGESGPDGKVAGRTVTIIKEPLNPRDEQVKMWGGQLLDHAVPGFDRMEG